MTSWPKPSNKTKLAHVLGNPSARLANKAPSATIQSHTNNRRLFPIGFDVAACAAKLPSATIPLVAPLCLALIASATIASQAQARNFALEEVVVTAQKREQNALDVPVTIDTFSNKDLENTGAVGIEDIQEYIPGLETGDSVTQNTIKIRGIENSNISSGQDPSVASFFDEVYLPAAAITISFSDLSQIEVLKGPQGTLFGRNAAAGVINIIPNQPNMEELEGFVTAKVGNHRQRRYEGMVNIPLTDTMAIRANLLTNRLDFYGNNLGPQTTDPYQRDTLAARLAFRWDISDKLATQIAYDYDKVRNGSRAAYGVGTNSNFTDVKDRTIEQDVMDPGEDRDMHSIIGKLWYDISDTWAMKLITSYRPYETYNRQDEDGTADDDIYLDTNNIFDSDIFYNELQLNYTGDSFNAVFGANYSQEDVYQLTTATASKGVLGAALPGTVGLGGLPIDTTLITTIALAGAEDFFTESLENTGEFKNYGIYADVDFTVNDWLNILVGLRYSVDDKSFTFFTPLSDFSLAQLQMDNFVFLVTDGVEEGSESWDALTGRLVANVQISEGAMAFFTYSTGYKSGGFDSLSIVTKDDPLDPEIVENIEFGVKGDFFENTIRTQVSVFYSTIDGRQEVVESLQPGAAAARPSIVNADEEITGFEITLDWVPYDGFRMGVVYSERKNERQREPYFDNQGDFRTGDGVNASAPKDYTITMDWSVPFPVGGLYFHADYIFKDNINREDEEHIAAFNDIPGYAEDTKLVNARLVWVAESGKYEIGMYGKNLDNDDSFGVPTGLLGGITGDYVAQPEEETSYGLDLKWVF